jgi:ABC-2 type transport system ATP-binding protein
MHAAADPAVSIRGLRKTYGGRTVLDDVSLDVARGELVALLGPNGAGKTTTLEILEGYRRADGGEVRVLGLDPARDGGRLRPRIGLMLQDGGVDPRTTPREMLRLFARFFADPADPDQLIGTAGLQAVAGTHYRRLSGGERQRLALALALVGRPELLILDEPTAGMDPDAKATTRTLIRRLRDAGATILLTTHDLVDVERLADRVAVLSHGRIAALDTPAALNAASTPAIRVRFAIRPDAAALSALHGRVPGTLIPDGADRFHVDGRPPDPALIAALATACAELGLLISELTIGSSSLEDRYLELVGRRAADEPERERGIRL